MADKPNPLPIPLGQGVAIGTAGLVLGAIVASLIASPSVPERDDVKASAEPTPVEDNAQALVASEALTDEDRRDSQGDLEANPRRSMEEDNDLEGLDIAPSPGPISKELVTAIRARKWLRRFRTQVHERIGEGTLVNQGKITAKGAELLTFVRGFVDHGMDITEYNFDELEKQFTGDGNSPELEARFGRLITKALIDFKYMKTAGPFRLSGNVVRLMKKRSRRAKILKTVIQVILAENNAKRTEILMPKHPYYQRMLEAYARYKKFTLNDDCPKIPKGWRIMKASRSGPLTRLQKRLACEGYFTGEVNGKWSDELDKALRLYQLTHDLEQSGLAFSKTIRSMNVPMAQRTKQIALALKRLRESRVEDHEGGLFFWVNLPSFRLRLFEDSKVILEHKVIVGTNRLDDNKQTLVQGHLNRTKLFKTNLYEVIINPSWILPERIQKGEILTRLEEDPDYLEKKKIKKVTLKDGREVLIQRRGKENPLGKVKFLLEKSNAIYLHDTDKRWLFKEQRRDFSHGCVRVHKAMDLARWLLRRDGQEDKQIERWLNSSTPKGIKLKDKVPLFTEYVTVDMTDDGHPIFLGDIYKYDKAYAQGKLPPREKIRWGHDVLRPRWVPYTPRDVVMGWKAEGKSAPRNLKP